jgi:hypothetical protein
MPYPALGSPTWHKSYFGRYEPYLDPYLKYLNSEERSYLVPWCQKSVPILTIFRADPTRGVYAQPCPGVTYLAQVLVWALGVLPRPQS